jgi:hypothetical protein
MRQGGDASPHLQSAPEKTPAHSCATPLCGDTPQLAENKHNQSCPSHMLPCPLLA